MRHVVSLLLAQAEVQTDGIWSKKIFIYKMLGLAKKQDNHLT